MNKFTCLFILGQMLVLGAVPCSGKCLPLGTKELLSLLPASPPALDKLAPWKLTVSRGRQDIEVDWLTTTAERTFQQDLQEAEAQPATVSIRILDSGMYPLPLQMFGIDPITNPRRNQQVQGHPAMERGADPGFMRRVILVGGRFLVDVQVRGLSPADFDRLLAALPLGAIAAAKRIPLDSLPSVITLTFIDELNQEGNSARKSFFLTQADRRIAEEEHAKFMERPREEYYGSGPAGGGEPGSTEPPPE